MEMKLFFYCMREFDELEIARECSQKYGIEFDYTTEYPSLENAHLAAGADGISFTPCDMSALMVEAFAAQGVKYLCCHSIGYNHVDLARAHALGLRVSNLSYPPSGVADFAIMLILMSLRQLGHQLKRSEVQDYSLKGKMGRELPGTTVGVIGTGSIGSCVIEHLQGFGCPILAYDPYPNPKLEGKCRYVSLDELLAQSEIITLHCPVTPQTTHILDREAFAKCRDGVILVNTARGALVDTPALIDALESGKVGAAGLDVLEEENGLYYYNRSGDVICNRQMAILRSFPNVVLTPHTAFYTDLNVRSMVEGNFRSLYLMASGQEDPHELNADL